MIPHMQNGGGVTAAAAERLKTATAAAVGGTQNTPIHNSGPGGPILVCFISIESANKTLND